MCFFVCLFQFDKRRFVYFIYIIRIRLVHIVKHDMEEMLLVSPSAFPQIQQNYQFEEQSDFIEFNAFYTKYCE